ncbi:hypothetical protein HKD37_17G046676 [Glycine soja]
MNMNCTNIIIIQTTFICWLVAPTIKQSVQENISPSSFFNSLIHSDGEYIALSRSHPPLRFRRISFISICGYGSLLSETSARITFPRLFNSVGRIFSLTVLPISKLRKLPDFLLNHVMIPAFIDREREYRFLAVVPESLDGKPFTNPAVLCASYTDEEFFKFRCNSIQAYILVLAAKSLGDEVHNNFLDHTFLADRKTTIHQYFEKVSTCILEEEPPESLKTRYGG